MTFSVADHKCARNIRTFAKVTLVFLVGSRMNSLGADALRVLKVAARTPLVVA